MLFFNPLKKNCSGCSACYSVCPIKCINMKADKEGFLYPEASNACINCGMCKEVCPAFKSKKDNPFPQRAMAAVSKSYKIWRRSSSGGAFSEICRSWGDKNTLIAGAVWNGFYVHHTVVSGYENIAPLCKSKYLSSDLKDTLVRIKMALDEGNKAIFCGCPCQVDGLKQFLRKDYPNLLTLDFICHGQGSPFVFETCMDVMSEFDIKEKIIGYQFRAKRKRYEEDHIAILTTKNSKYHVVQDRYMQLFLSQDILRPSCGQNCKYRDLRRPGDITIADFKGLSSVFPDMAWSKKNYSTIVCNTNKGEECFNRLTDTMETRPCTIEDIIKYNPLFAQQTHSSINRDTFFKEFQSNRRSTILAWTVPTRIYKPTIKQTIITFIPSSVLRILQEIYHRMSRKNQ